MKEVIAILRINMMNKTKKALADVNISSFTVKDVLGRGRGIIDFKILKGAEKGYEEAISQLGNSQRLIPKRMISIVLPDKLVKKCIETIIDVNRTGKPGDGKIFVCPVIETFRVRTGEEGEIILD
ncbi:MAG: P-II family nitrogen regulator [Chitinispirillaceae bacterium]|nr:P-II family nitrogen regulator [Chitinispirillaceae bacterium]